MTAKQIRNILLNATKLFVLWDLTWVALECIHTGTIQPDPVDDIIAVPVYVLMILVFYYREKYEKGDKNE